MTEDIVKTRPVSTNTGNPRVAVAFPFSKIEIRASEPASTQLAAVVQDLAAFVAALSHELSPARAEAADRLVQRARLLTEVV